MYRLIFIFVIIISGIYCNEKIFYTAKFRNINAGSAILETKNDFESGLIDVDFSLQTRKMIDMFYKLRDNVHISIDSNDYSLKQFRKTSQQGKYKKIDEAIFDYNNNNVKYNKQVLTINNKIYDPLSIIAFLRNQILSIGEKYTFSIYSKGEIKLINLEVLKEESINIKNKQYNCFVIGHNNNNSEIKFWLDKTPPFIPIIIETKSKNGDILLKYKSHKFENG